MTPPAVCTSSRNVGIRIAIDDFGTGYSSLAYLQEFPVDVLKIDRTFVAGMSESSEGEALVHALVQLGKALGLETLAEGIETQPQLERLRSEQCDLGQGYLFARPMEAVSGRRRPGGRVGARRAVGYGRGTVVAAPSSAHLVGVTERHRAGRVDKSTPVPFVVDSRPASGLSLRPGCRRNCLRRSDLFGGSTFELSGPPHDLEVGLSEVQAGVGSHEPTTTRGQHPHGPTADDTERRGVHGHSEHVDDVDEHEAGFEGSFTTLKPSARRGRLRARRGS